MSVFRDRQGTLWFPNSRGRVSFLRDGQRGDVSLPGLAADDFALAFGDDAEGGLWIGTEDAGLLHCRPAKVRSLSSREGLPHDRVWALCEARDGSIWVGTDGGAARFRDGRFTPFTEAEGLSRNAVRSIVEDEDGRIWIGTTTGLNWIEDGRLHQHRFPGDWFNTKIRTLLAGRNRTLWVGTARGLYCLRLADHSAATNLGSPAHTVSLPAAPFEMLASYRSTNGLRSDDIRALHEDRAGNLWIGTWLGGLHCFKDGQFEPCPEADDLSDYSVWTFYEDNDGALWLGTERGLVRLKNGHGRVFTSREGLPEDVMNHILGDDTGHLWLGGERGIYRVRKRDLDDLADGQAATVNYVVYDEDEGLASRETNGQKNQPGALKTRDGCVWFPTTKGVAIFDPKQLPDQTNPPPVMIEQVQANGETIFDNKPGQRTLTGDGCLATPADGPFALRAGSGRILEIQYTASSFLAADKLRFKYRLQGLEKDWTDAGPRRVAPYANLRPGRYQFQVVAANKYGTWNQAGAAFAFTLAPFFWQTGWFKTVSVLVPLLAGYLIYRRSVLRHRRLAEAEHQAALANERADIARDLHDSLGPRFTAVQHLSASLNGTPAASHSGKTPQAELMRLANELNACLDGAVWAVQPDKDTLLSLAD
ncbi:MAG TPA: two-component regulator propeller domain-containing protein, partial [Candidatus Dormibacteraeota bacterium]|nr:two-component regulator propeller domain-containing protein [Candidatus Dormibacteraeota bacterium]